MWCDYVYLLSDYRNLGSIPYRHHPRRRSRLPFLFVDFLLCVLLWSDRLGIYCRGFDSAVESEDSWLCSRHDSLRRVRIRSIAVRYVVLNPVRVFTNFVTPIMIADWVLKTGYFFFGTALVGVVGMYCLVPEVRFLSLGSWRQLTLNRYPVGATTSSMSSSSARSEQEIFRRQFVFVLTGMVRRRLSRTHGRRRHRA